MAKLNKLEAMRVFVEVAACGSFAAASRSLKISAPAVTRSISDLEDALGVRLFVRTTRHVRLTDSGQRFLIDAKRIIDDLEEAEAAAAGSFRDPKGVLTVTAPVLFGQQHVTPIVTKYLDANPAVSVKLLLFDRINHLMEDGLDVAVRIGALEDSGLFAIRVGCVRRVICASPTYLAQRGKPEKPDDLVNHNIVVASPVEETAHWKFCAKRKTAVRLTPRLICNHNSAAISAALSDWGITRVLSYQVGEELESGRLVEVLRDFEPDRVPIHLVHLEGRRANAKTRAFVELATEELRANPFILHDDPLPAVET